MLRNQEPDRNLEELTDAEIYAAIQYLEPDSQDSERPDDYGGLVFAIFFLVLLLGAIGIVWFY